ncbi:branched-chain amino acid ABC transporter permease, partial [Thioclava sp. BHET1]
MNPAIRNTALFALVGILFLLVGAIQSWTLALTILNDGLIVAIMALGVNMQWGYAGLFNIGIAGFFALGGLGMVLGALPFDGPAWSAGGLRILLALVVGAAFLFAAVKLWRGMAKGKARSLAMVALLVVGFVAYRFVFDPGVAAMESINAVTAGYIGGVGLPVLG